MNSLKSLSKPKAIIYDWDNTLVDSWPLIQRSIDKTMIAFDKEPWGLEKVKNSVHQSMRESFPQIFGDKWQEAGEIYKKSYHEIHLDIDFLPNAYDLIRTVAKTDILQFVISNKVGSTLRQECKALRVSDLFFAIIGAHDAYNDKPSKDPVDLALMGSDLDPNKDEIWFIGDTIADVHCALNSGCRPIIFKTQDGSISKSISPQLIKEKSIISYDDHLEIKEILLSLTDIESK